MAMQYDVKATQVTSTNTAYADTTRVKAVTVSYASGGTVFVHCSCGGWLSAYFGSRRGH
jgi:hypothetical protein